MEIWKRFRKWGGIPTGITQNVKDLLASREIENIFENSDFIQMCIRDSFKILGVSAYPLNGEERLQIMYETFNQDSKVPFHFSYDDVLPVSYTHLDVYKRQTYHYRQKGFCTVH